jgi:two-component system CheB/CheR fusion protein
MTGDISSATLRDIAAGGCMQFNKPVKLAQLTAAIGSLLAVPAAKPPVSSAGTILVVDDDPVLCALLTEVFEAQGHCVKSFADAEGFLRAAESDANACLLVDAYLPGMCGCTLLETLAAVGRHLPAIMITGRGDVKMAVRAMRAGAVDFIEKPAKAEELRLCVARALKFDHGARQKNERTSDAIAKLARLTARQHEIMQRVLAGDPSKNIAADLGISQRTVEYHRASIMAKTGARSIPALARLAMTAERAGT